MKRLIPSGILLVSLGLFLPESSFAQWPQWRGPNRDGKSPESGLLKEWPEGGPPTVWTAEGLGRGFSSVSLANGRVFTMGDFDDKQFVIAINDDDGSILWKTSIGESWSDARFYPGSRSTPTVDGDRVYAYGTEGTLACLKADNGEVVWQRNVREDFGGFMMVARGVNWRFAESPLVDGNRVVVTPGAPKAVMVALDKTSGEEIWRASMPEIGEQGSDGAGYSSIVISHGGGVKQYVQLMGRGLVGILAEDGEFLWGYNRIANEVANIATPIVTGDFVFGSTGYQTGAALLKLSRDGDGVRAEEVYFLPADTFQNHHGGLIFLDGYIYTGTGHNRGYPLSVRMETGEVAWGPVRNEGRDSAAIAYADGRLYFRYQNGLVVLIDATPEEYRECGSFEIPDVEDPSWPHPVVSGGRLYLREQGRLHSYDIRAE